MANYFVTVCSPTVLGTPVKAGSSTAVTCYMPDGSAGKLYTVNSYLLPESGGNLIWWLPPISQAETFEIIGAMASVLALAFVFRVIYRMFP